MAEDVPVDFKWVKARAECSLAAMFKGLEQGIRDDVEERRSLLHERDDTRFEVVGKSTKHFSVIRTPDPMTSIGYSVDFHLEQDEIIASYSSQEGDRILLRATITLTNEGRCKFKVGALELENWQLRRMALEHLFFHSQR